MYISPHAVCPNPSPSSTVGTAVSIAGHSSIPPYGPAISLSSATPQTTPAGDHTNASDATPSDIPSNIPAIGELITNMGVGIGTALGLGSVVLEWACEHGPLLIVWYVQVQE